LEYALASGDAGDAPPAKLQMLYEQLCKEWIEEYLVAGAAKL
jgi:hypothetical protein